MTCSLVISALNRRSDRKRDEKRREWEKEDRVAAQREVLERIDGNTVETKEARKESAEALMAAAGRK